MEYFLVLAGLVGLFFEGDWLVRRAYGLTFAAWRVRAAEWGRLFDGLCEIRSGHVLKKAALGNGAALWLGFRRSISQRQRCFRR